MYKAEKHINIQINGWFGINDTDQTTVDGHLVHIMLI